MLDTYLVQRLTSPPENDLLSKAAQVFGGGNLGLKEEAWKILKGVFGFDYMGSAEYEFGAIPQCLQELGKDNANLRAIKFTVEAKDIERNWNRTRADMTKRGTPRKKQPKHPPIQDRVVYLLCREEHIEGAKEAIRKLAGNKIRTKSSSQLARVLDPIGEEYLLDKVKGWLELDNGFFFFVDEDMWRKTTVMFTGQEPETA